jgi:hypothetical protein
MKKTVPLLLIGLVMPCFSQNIFAADSGRAWNDNWLYAGGRLGDSVHFYQFGDYDIKITAPLILRCNYRCRY